VAQNKDKKNDFGERLDSRGSYRILVLSGRKRGIRDTANLRKTVAVFYCCSSPVSVPWHQESKL
jgi:hypothetical protein